MNQRSKTIGKVKCWEVFKCKEEECPAYRSKNFICWLFSGTRCRNEIQGKFVEKMQICIGCKVFKTNIDVTSMEKTIKVINKQFEETGEKYKTITESSLTGIFIHQDGKFVFVNNRFAEIHGYKPEELLGKNHLSLIYPDERETLKEIASKRLKGETVPQRYEVQRVRKDGKTIWCEMMATCIQYKGRPAIMGNIIDITERKQAEEKLRERTHDLWGRVKELKCLYGILELIEEESISLEEVFRKTVERIPFAWQYPEITCARVIVDGQESRTKNFKETVWKQVSDIIVNGEKIGTVEVYYLKEMPISYEGLFQKEEINLLNAIAKHLERVIKRTMAEETLRDSEEKYRTVFENTGSATIIIEEDTMISLINTKFEKLSGYSKEEIEGKKSWTEFFVKDDLDGVKEYHLMRRTNPKTAPPNYEARFIDRQGQVRDILLIVSTIPGTKKSVESLLDVTERKKLEEQMYQTEKLAAIGTLAAGVAHEINNPLAIILGFTDLLLEKVPADSELNDLLKTVQKQGINAKRIVENLLSFARHREHKEEELDINQNIEAVLAVEGNTLSLNTISVKKDMAESLPKGKGDPGELQQVFFNIINNAVSAMKGGGVLTIFTRAIDGRQNVEIRISDTGIGIKPEHRTRIFEPLFTTKKVGEGTGLGLTVSYAIIKKLGGEIIFETKTKEESTKPGTAFIITLPAIKEL
jgi:PAS domain S-box-containing protein